MKQAKLATPPVAQINVRIERSLKDEGDAVLAEAGISPSQIVRDLWGKIAQRGDALDEVMKTLGSEGRSPQEQEAIDAKLAVLDRMTRRRDELARCIVDFRTFSCEVLADGSDLAILNQHISDFVKMLCRIDDPATFEYQFHSCFPPVRTKVKSAMRTATPFWTSS